jgi:hypothetical protein
VLNTCLRFHFSTDFLPRQQSHFGHETFPPSVTLATI